MTLPHPRRLFALAPALVAAASLLQAVVEAQTNPPAIPRIVQRDGRHALMVDGAPFLILGAQANNSSAWPAMMSKVWPAIEFIQANTLEIPIYWQQFEPQPGHFDYSMVDLLLAQAREHRVRLVLAWFGTWKNGSSHYAPPWMKADPDRYPRVVGPKGVPVDSPSPHAPARLTADVRAFSALMRHLREADPRRTVIMVQVENEPGTYGSIRDYSRTAQELFDGPVPRELLTAMHKPAPAGASWPRVFGPDAEEYFHAWSVASFIGKVAAAGKAEYSLPLYTNAALRDPLHPGPPGTYESGGPTDNVIAIWKAAAPALDLVAPDIYMSDRVRILKVMDLYHRPDNALFVPETGNALAYARYFFAALGRQAIGYSPFGIDYTGYSNAPLGAARINEETLAQFALNYKLIGPIMREVARLNYDGKLQAVVEDPDHHWESLDFGPWKAVVSYGLPSFGPGDNPRGNQEPDGRALVGQIGENQFLVAGLFCRVDFQVSETGSGKQREFVRVEEGTYVNGVFKPVRIWNGDQTDWGLNFNSAPQVLRVSLGTY